MNKSGLNLTIISVVLIALSIGLAGLLSILTPADSYIDIAQPPSPSSATQSGDGDNAPAALPQPQPVQGGLTGGNADAIKEGRLPGYEDDEVNTDADTFSYLIMNGITLDSPDAEGNIMVENNPGNHSPMQLCFYIEGSDELIYVSPMLQPGEHVSGDFLSVKLKKGEYKVNAVISVYDEETLELKTTFHQSVTLTVNQKFLGIF